MTDSRETHLVRSTGWTIIALYLSLAYFLTELFKSIYAQGKPRAF